jgi:hypothetical protein
MKILLSFFSKIFHLSKDANNLIIITFKTQKEMNRSQSYQTLILSLYRFLLLSLSVCRIRKYCHSFEIAKLSSKKRKKSLFYEEKKFGRIVFRFVIKHRKKPSEKTKNKKRSKDK